MRGALLVALLLTGCAGTAPRAAAPAPAPEGPGLRWQDAKLLAEAVDRLQSDYVDEVSSRALVIEALRGMLAGLDPYSAYLSPEEYAELGEYTGGAIPGAVPTAPTTDGSGGAPAPGVSGDAPTTPMPVSGAPARTASDSPAAGDSTRATPSVIATRPRPGLVQLRIRQFNVNTADELTREFARLRAAGPIKGAVLDLRGNAGGVFSAGASVADLFIDSGVLLRSEGRAAGTDFVREATPGDLLAGAPLIVVVDAATASSAEIVAGALQDRGRALVLGTRTYGKGSVQSVIPLRSGGAVKFTTARYLLPSGRSIDGTGITPDLPLEALAPRGATDPALDFALEKALDALAAVIRSR